MDVKFRSGARYTRRIWSCRYAFARYESGLKLLHVAPFVTLAFLFLMFLFFACNFCGFSGVRIGDGGLPGGSEILQITMAGDGVCRVGGRPVSREQLTAFLSEIAFRDPEVILTVSRKLPVEAVTAAWQLCRDSAIRRISLLTD